MCVCVFSGGYRTEAGLEGQVAAGPRSLAQWTQEFPAVSRAQQPGPGVERLLEGAGLRPGLCTRAACPCQEGHRAFLVAVWWSPWPSGFCLLLG